MMRVCPTCQVGSIWQTSPVPCWLCGGPTFEECVGFSAGGAIVSADRCWADRFPSSTVVATICREPATTPVGLCDQHHLEMVG